MIFIKVSLFIIITLSFVVVASVNKYKTLNIMLIVFLFFVSTYLIFVPSEADTLARFLGLEKGTDFVLYLSESILFLFIVSLYVKGRRQDRIITKMIRKRALDKCSKSDEVSQ